MKTEIKYNFQTVSAKKKFALFLIGNLFLRFDTYTIIIGSKDSHCVRFVVQNAHAWIYESLSFDRVYEIAWISVISRHEGLAIVCRCCEHFPL